MNRPFFASVVARERKNEITKEPVVPPILREAESDVPTLSKQMDLQLAPILILISFLALFLIG